MTENKKPFISIPFYQQLIYVLIFNTGIALTVYAILNGSLISNLTISHSIGLSILFSYHLFNKFFSISLSNLWLPIILGALLSIIIMAVINNIFNGVTLSDVIKNINETYIAIIRILFLALIFSFIVVHYLFVRSRMMESEKSFQLEKIKNIDNEKRVIETQLRLLQAQIEPHFLFNTLSNICSLIDSNPALGKKMLINLNHYLRSSLKRSRTTHSTLAQEINLIQHYLEILKIRMGDRLQYTIDIADELMGFSLSPLLLQPLVENSIKHGLEPTVDGGSIKISAHVYEDNILSIMIADNGQGFQENLGAGVGLDNVRERLKFIYGELATLSIESNENSGVTVLIKVPYENL